MGWTGTDPTKWASRTEALMTALLRSSVQELAKEAGSTIKNGGRVPVASGNLGRSVVVSNTPPTMDARGVKHETPRDNAGGIEAIVPGKDVFIGWTPQYSRRANYGFVGTDSLGRTYNQSGYGFAESTAAKWEGIVKVQAAKIANR